MSDNTDNEAPDNQIGETPGGETPETPEALKHALDNLDTSRGSTETLDAAVDESEEALTPAHGLTDEDLAEDAVGRGEGVGQALEVEGLSQGRIVLRRFIRHRGAVFGMIIFLFIFLVAFSSMGIGSIPGWWKWSDPQGIHDVQNQGEPTMHLPRWLGGSGWTGLGDFPFGQDLVGHDNFAQVMKGVQTSIMVMLVMGLVALILGVLIGAVSGYYRGWVDNVLMRFTDLIITLPLIVVGAVLGKLISTLPIKYNWPADTIQFIQRWMPLELALVLGLVLWPGLARLTRSEFLRLREYEFVDSAKVAGASDRRIIFKHILPNAMGVIIVNVTLLMSSSVVLEAALSFLGFGIYPPSVSLGLLISDNQAAFNTRPWLFWWPGLFIILIALSVNFIGDGLRDAFDPRTRRIPSKRAMERAEKKVAAESKAEADAAQALQDPNVGSQK